MVRGNHRGWTLVELMIVAAIVGLIAMITPSVLNQIAKFFILSKTKIELQQQARNMMYLMTRELRQAQSNSIVIDRATSQPYYSRISFTKVGGGQVVTFFQTGSYLIMNVRNTSTNVTDRTQLSNNLAYVGFTFPRSDDMTIVSVSMTLQEAIYQGGFKALHMASERIRVMN